MADMMEQNGKDLYGSLQDIQEKTVARGRQLAERYGWKPVRIPAQEEAVGQVIGTSGNPVEDSYRYNSAIAFSQYYGISLPDAMKNLDSLYEAQTGKQYEPNATAWQSIVNSFTVGTRTVDLQAHKNEWRKAVLSGDTQRASTLEKEITDEEEYLASLADYAPRSWVTKALQWTANTLPYTVMTGAGAGLIGAAVGGAVSLATGGLALPAVIAAGTVSGLATKAATFGITEPLFEGDTFWDLKHQDVVGADGQAHRIEIDNDVAANLARWDGIFNAAIESELGIGSKLAGMIGGGVLSKAVQETLGSLMARGVTSRILLSIGKAVMDGAGEAAQEGMEELVDTGSRALAYQLSGYVPRDTVEATAKRALTAAGQAWVSSMIMGLPVSGIQVAANIGDARRMVADAKGDSRSLFVSKHLTAKPEGVSYTKWFKSLNGMYDRYHKGEAGGDENTESFHRLENGKLYATEEIVSPKNEQGVETRRYLIGDPEVEDGKRGAQYGAIDFELSDNGNRLTITDVSMNKGHEDLTVEAVTDLIDEYSKADVAWDTNGNEQLQAVKDSLTEQNNGSLQLNSPDQVQGHQKVVNAISRAFGSSLNNKQLYTAADVLEAMAQTKGMTGEQYLAKYFANGGFQKLSSAEGQAVLRQSGMSEGDVNGLTQFVTDGKAIVYAAEHGNFSTFVHESFHVLERVTDSTQQLEDAIQAAGRSGQLAGYVKAHDRLFSDGLFTTDDEGKVIDAATRITQVVESWGDGKDLTKAQQEIRSEIMARLFEGYLYDGKTFSPQLKTIFAKIAQWMRRIYRGMETHGVTLTDDIVRAYDDLLTRKDSGVARAEGEKGVMAQKKSVFGDPSEDALDRARSRNINVAEWIGRRVDDFARKYSKELKEDILADSYKTIDGLRIVTGIAEKDMPFYKELGQMKILQSFGMNGILLPRFSSAYLHSLYGVSLEHGSMSDGIVLLEGGHFVELKRSKRVGSALGDAMGQIHEMVFISSMKSLSKQNVTKHLPKILESNSQGSLVIILSEPDCKIYANFAQKNSGDRDEHGSTFAHGSKSTLAEWEEIPTATIKDIIKKYFVNDPDDQRPIPYDDYKNAEIVSESVKPDVLAQTVDTPSMAEVRRKYEGTEQWMKAPNGERSNLPERQWLQVRTPEFKKWFGDWEDDPENASKVVDENGEPLVVYHGTGERFTVFDRSLIGENTSNDGIWGKGFYFTPDMDLAQEYADGTESPDAHVEGTFLKMSEPYEIDRSVLDTSFSDAELAAAKDAREKAEGDPDSPYALLSYSMEDAQLVDMYRKISHGERFDGVIYHGEEDARGYNRDEYVALSPNQIKSATDNNGAFDSNDPSILAQAAYHGSAYLFDKFKTDKVNSGEGSQSFGWGLYFTQSKHIAAEYAQRQGDLKFKDGGRVAGLPDLLSVMGGESESLKKFEDTVDRISGKPDRWKEVLDNFCVGIGVSDNDFLKAIDYASFETRPKGNTFDEMMKSRSSGLTDKEDAVKAALEDFLNTKEGLRFYDLSHTWGRHPHYVYSVELPDGKYLDWDAPVPEEDRHLIRSRFQEEAGQSLPDEIEGDPELDRPDNHFETGRDFYRGLREMPYFRGEARDVSGFLHRLGYKGIVYDAGSIHGGGDGARNLVVFDENDIRITGKTLFQRVPASQVQKARTRDMERIERSAREALIRTVGDETRLMDIARSCQSFEEFRDKVSDEFVHGQERIPRMDIGQFAQTTWDYMKMLDGGDLYGDHEMSEAARDAESADAFKEWLTRNRPDLEESLKKGNELTLETWLRALYQEADGSMEGNVQEATNATAILNEERRKRREKSLDNRFKELAGTDEGLDQVISAFASDDTQLPPEARIVVEAASQEEVDAAREALKRDPRLYRTLYAEKTGNKAWSSTDLQGEMPMIGDPVGRMRYVMGQSERKRRLSARGLANKQLADAVRTGDMKYLNGIADEILQKAQDEISQLEDQVREARRQGKKDTDQAVKDLKRQISEKEAEKREARRQRQYMQSLADFITRPPAKNVDIDTALEIQMLVEKSGIDPFFRNGRAKFQGKMQTVDEIRKWLEEHGGMDAHGAEISASLFDKLTKKPLNDWTVSDLEDMASYVWALEEHGRQVYLQKQTALQLERRGIQAGLVMTLRASGRKPDTELPITDEAKVERRKRRSRQGMLLETVNPEHAMKLLDNLEENGAWFQEFVQKKRDAQDVEWANKARRIASVLDKLEAIGYKLDDLNRTVAYGDKHISVAELAFAELAQRNEETWQAYAYGLLVGRTEKDQIRASMEGRYETEADLMNEVNREIEKMGDSRYRDIISLASLNLTDKDRQAMEILSTDMGGQIGRINDVAHRVYNLHVDGVQAYLPHFRMDVGGVEANAHQQMADMMNAEASIESNTGVFKGFTKQRIKMNAYNQTPIQSNLVDVWRKSLDATEHFIAFSALNQEWNGVVRGYAGRSVIGALQSYRGKAYADYLTDYMNEVITPKRMLEGDSRLVKALRGNLPAAYLAFKPSGVVLQMITSPAAFLKELSPAEYLAAVGQWMTDMKGMDGFIMERSPFMRQRQGVIEQAVSDAIANDPSMPAWQRKMSRLTSIGMAGMEFADHSAVHPGWIALYRKKLRELGGVETQETMAEAARYADDIVHTTQPVSDRTEMAPLFKKGGAMGVLTQFTASMNVIWNNVTIDAVGLARQAGNKTLPAEVRMQAFRRLAGQTMGYALAGLVLGAVQQGFKGKDDDDDKGKKVRKGLYYATTQFSGATPLVGDFVDWTIEKVLTGESGYVGGDSFYPALTAMQRALSAKTPAKQAENALRALGLATGMPVSGIRQAVRAVEEKSLLPFIGR